MTSAPAARLRLEGRGRVQPGAIADIVLFNPKTIVDRSTFTDPGVLSSGVEKVFVGGELVWAAGKAYRSGAAGTRADVGTHARGHRRGPVSSGARVGHAARGSAVRRSSGHDD